VNGATHEQYAKVTAHLVRARGGVLGDLLRDGRNEFVTAASLPDRVHEVACSVPGGGARVELFGHGLSSCEHFQREVQAGYRWMEDGSLSVVGAPSAAMTAAAGMRIAVHDEDPRPPLTPLWRPTPMALALRAQPGRALGFFEFPSAGAVADFYAAAAQSWARDEGNAVGWRRCAGYALHFVQDACVPHHAWGVLLYGHASWEDELQAAWHRVLVDTVEGDLVDSTLAPAVASELRGLQGLRHVSEVCEANAAWSRARFGAPHDLPECPGGVALRVSVRAIAASIRACELMGGAS
jgi:hypothetical protein